MAEHKTGANEGRYDGELRAALVRMAKLYVILQDSIDLILAGIRVQTRDVVVGCPDDDMTVDERRLWEHRQWRRLSKQIKLLGRLLDCKIKADTQFLRSVSDLRELREQAAERQKKVAENSKYQKLFQFEIAKARAFDEQQK